MRLLPRLVVPLLATFSVWPGVAATQEARITAIENVRVLTMTAMLELSSVKRSSSRTIASFHLRSVARFRAAHASSMAAT